MEDASTMTNNDDATALFHDWCRQCLADDGATTTIRQAAQTFFRTTSTPIAAASSTHLAQLLRALEPCFPTAAPVLALACLEGALRGCSSGGGIDAGVVPLLQRFLLEYVRPLALMEDDDDNENAFDTDTVRDAGLKAMQALLPLLSQQDEMLQLAQQAVEQRCIPDALGLLPRSRRSLCFQVLQTAAGNATTTSSKFGSFCIQCLHGESDPRCLWQLLMLLDTALPTPLVDESLIESLFDAASPYYPIQFSPPPNDVHGITRDDLCGALWKVLAKTPAATIALVLETLEDAASLSEQTELLRDLEQFFFVKDDDDDTSFPLSDPNDVRHLSHSLVALHERHCIPTATPEARKLADAVRALARRIAAQTEPNNTLFRAFVIDVTDTLTTTRAGAAYLVGLASTAAESNSKTWTVCWNAGWTTTNVAVCGAWCAAARATGRAPLAVADAIAALTAVYEGILLPTDEDVAVVVNRTPAIRALESVLLVSPVVEGLAWAERVRTMVRALVTLVLHDDDGMEEESEREYFTAERDAASLTLGVFLGCAFDEDTSKFENTFLVVAAVRDLLIDEVLPRLLNELNDDSKTPYIHRTLSMIAKSGLGPMQKVVEPLVADLPRDIATDSSTSTVNTLAYLFENTDGLGAVAFQACDTEPVINALMGPFADVEQTSFRMSNLVLPESKEELEVMDDVIGNSYQSVIMVLRKGFTIGVTKPSIEKLMQSISMELPPLRPADTVRLSLLFPLLSSALEGAECEAVPQSVHEMVPHFADFALSSENNNIARVHAARCLHACIGRYALPNTSDCPGRELIKSKINQCMLSTSPARASDLADALRLLALIGSAAALRGGTSTETAVAVTQFLVEIACRQSSQAPFMEGDWKVTLSQSTNAQEAEEVSIQAAESVGNLLTTDEKRLKLRKQRLAHLTTKHLQEYAKQHVDKSTQGCLALTSHLLCSVHLAQFSTDQRCELASLLPSSLKQPNSISPNLLRVLLAAIVKLLRSSPESLNSDKEPLPLVAGLLRAFGTGHLSCQVLALEALASLPLGKSSEIRSAVANILEPALAHPSTVLRQAAANVRNTWFLAK